MASLILCSQLSDESGGHSYEILEPGESDTSWPQPIIDRYLQLRASLAVPLEDVPLDELVGFDASQLRDRLQTAAVPAHHGGPWDIVRADFGEVVACVLLEERFGTQIGTIGVRDRELRDQPGRGLDMIGVETHSDPLLLVLVEAKVSDEARTPPRVVDAADDCLRNQHLGHLTNLVETTDKVWMAAQRSRDGETRDALFKAALLLEANHSEGLRIIAASVLVRSAAHCQDADFGTFRSSPEDYTPAVVRFLIFRTPEDVESTVRAWAEALPDAETPP